MNVLYQAAANASGTAFGADGDDVEIFKLIVGNPTTSANIYLFHEINPGSSSNTTGLVFKHTAPGTLATGQLPYEIDLTDGSGHGLILNSGGSVIIDQSLQLTVLWAPASENAGV